MEDPQKYNLQINYDCLSTDATISLLGICPKEGKSLLQRHICAPLITAALLTIGKIRKQLKCLIKDECHPYKEDVIHEQKGILLSREKYEILPIKTTQMDLEGTAINETGQTEKD